MQLLRCLAHSKSTKGKAGIAAIIRDESGRILGGRVKSFISTSATVAEASAVRLATVLAIESNFNQVIIESDNVGVIGRINSKALSAWESAAIEADIIGISSHYPSLVFSFINRSCNGAADWVAKGKLRQISPNYKR
ncbi:hypothetical protein GQ457_07G006940 [Hibiscus cannabinus]